MEFILIYIYIYGIFTFTSVYAMSFFSTESLFKLRCPSLKSIKILFLVLNKYSFISWSLSTDWCKYTFTDYLSFVLGSLKFVIKLKPWPAINSRFWRVGLCVLKTENDFFLKIQNLTLILHIYIRILVLEKMLFT